MRLRVWLVAVFLLLTMGGGSSEGKLAKASDDEEMDYWMIMTEPRSGSNLLSLNLHLEELQICNGQEAMLLLERQRKSKGVPAADIIEWYETTDKIFGVPRNKCRSIGQKIFPIRFSQPLPEAFLEMSMRWPAFPRLKVIWLVRQEVMEQAFSLAEALAVNMWEGGRLGNEKVSVSASQVMGHATRAIRNRIQMSRTFEKLLPASNLFYLTSKEVFDDTYDALVRSVAFITEQSPQEVDRQHGHIIKARLASEPIKPLRQKKLAMAERFKNWPQLKRDLLQLAIKTHQPASLIEEIKSLQ